MKIVKASYLIECPEEPLEMLKRIERIARRCYKSEDLITDMSYVPMIKKLIEYKHYAMFDHAFVSVTFTTDRGVSHELVRHRMAAFGQESTRFCNYQKKKFGNQITFIQPDFDLTDCDKLLLKTIEYHYMNRLGEGLTPQQARYFLPNGLKTEITMTCDLTEWRHIFQLRTSPKAHPQMRELTIPLLQDFKDLIPVVFDDIDPNKKKYEHVCKLGRWYSITVDEARLECVECGEVISTAPAALQDGYVELTKIEAPWE